MESGILIRWGEPKTGRERDSIELYRETVGHYRRLVDEGKLSYFEPFMFTSGDTEVESGFFIVRGPVPELFSVLDSPEYRDQIMRASLILKHLRIDMLAVGERIDRNMAEYQTALAAVGS